MSASRELVYSVFLFRVSVGCISASGQGLFCWVLWGARFRWGPLQGIRLVGFLLKVFIGCIGLVWDSRVLFRLQLDWLHGL